MRQNNARLNATHFPGCRKLPRMDIGLRLKNQACLFDVSRVLQGEEVSKLYLVRTLPSSVPHRPHRKSFRGPGLGPKPGL